MIIMMSKAEMNQRFLVRFNKSIWRKILSSKWTYIHTHVPICLLMKIKRINWISFVVISRNKKRFKWITRKFETLLTKSLEILVKQMKKKKRTIKQKGEDICWPSVALLMVMICETIDWIFPVRLIRFAARTFKWVNLVLHPFVFFFCQIC